MALNMKIYTKQIPLKGASLFDGFGYYNINQITVSIHVLRLTDLFNKY